MKTYLIEEKEQVERIIKTEQICCVGFSDKDGIPYVLPMNYGYEEGVIYLHSAPQGKAIRILEHNPNVCITFYTQPKLIWQHPDVACSYRMQSESVVCNGIVEFVEEFSEKERILNIIMRQYIDKDFKYCEPAVNNVKIWKVALNSVTAKKFGVKPTRALFNR